MALRIFPHSGKILNGIENFSFRWGGFSKRLEFQGEEGTRKMTILQELRKIKLTILQELHITKSTRNVSLNIC